MQAKAAGSRHRDACQHGPCGAGNPIVQTPQNFAAGPITQTHRTFWWGWAWRWSSMSGKAVAWHRTAPGNWRPINRSHTC